MVHSPSRSGSISSQSSTSSCSSSSEDIPIRDPTRRTPPRKPLNLDAIEKYHQWNVPYSQMPRGPDHGQWSHPAPSVLQTVTDIQTELQSTNVVAGHSSTVENSQKSTCQTQKQAQSRAKPYHVTSPKSIKKRDVKKNGSPQKKRKKEDAQDINSQAEAGPSQGQGRWTDH